MIHLPPYVLGLPERYAEWRTNQAEAVQSAVDCDRRVYAAVAPTGAGKSLIYMAIAALTDWRTCILTATKALQDQLARDFGPLVCVVKGKQSYPCRILGAGYDCSMGLCNFGIPCNLKASGCRYYDQLRKAQRSDIVVTNYHFWCANNRLQTTDAQEKLGKFQLLVCDEAHSAPAITGDMFTVEFNAKRRVDEQVLEVYPWGGGVQETVMWLEGIIQTSAQIRADRLRAGLKDGGQGGSAAQAWKWQDLAVRASDAAKLLMAGGEVLCVPEKGKGVLRVAPVWPYEMGGRLLMADVPRVVMTSATVGAKTLGLLGLSPDDYRMTEYPHTFPVANRRLTWLPTVRMNKDTDAMDLRLLHMRIDQVLRTRTWANGIIHTVSYERQRQVLQASGHAITGYMLGHEQGEVDEAVRRFKDSAMPRCLVSPSVSTGYDFPGDECRFQIITKLAFPDTRDALTRARCARDEDLGAYTAMVDLVQACGRGVRAKDDWAESFILDDNVNWFMRRYKRFAPKWFTRAYGVRRRDDVPDGERRE